MQSSFIKVISRIDQFPQTQVSKQFNVSVVRESGRCELTAYDAL